MVQPRRARRAEDEPEGQAEPGATMIYKPAAPPAEAPAGGGAGVEREAAVLEWAGRTLRVDKRSVVLGRSRECDVQADEDQEKRPEARDREPRHARDEAQVLQEKDEAERDEEERPEDAAARSHVHERTRCTRNSTPIPTRTSGQMYCHWTNRKAPALFTKNTTPRAMRRYPTAVRRRSASASRIAGSTGADVAGAVVTALESVGAAASAGCAEDAPLGVVNGAGCPGSGMRMSRAM